MSLPGYVGVHSMGVLYMGRYVGGNMEEGGEGGRG